MNANPTVGNLAKTKQRAQSTRTRTPCLLIAVVCDIRGFTGLQARVDELALTMVLSDDDKSQTVRAYDKYMAKTQHLAKETILKKLSRQNRSYRQVAKSTGDGFLIVVELEPELLRQSYNANTAKKWISIATQLAQGTRQLVEDAQPKKNSHKFGGLTRSFITEHGQKLGLNAEFLDGGNRFRVAAALAMGTGGLVVPDSDEQNPEDAYGHPVNMAFRLCEKAGRPDEKDSDKYYPFILLDRRVARLLMQNKGLGDVFDDWNLCPHNDEVTMKGIEENWCYALISPDETKAQKE